MTWCCFVKSEVFLLVSSLGSISCSINGRLKVHASFTCHSFERLCCSLIELVIYRLYYHFFVCFWVLILGLIKILVVDFYFLVRLLYGIQLFWLVYLSLTWHDVIKAFTMLLKNVGWLVVVLINRGIITRQIVIHSSMINLYFSFKLLLINSIFFIINFNGLN